MSDEEDWDSDDPRRIKTEEPLPEYTMRFTDMPDNMVHKALRRKYITLFLLISQTLDFI